MSAVNWGIGDLLSVTKLAWDLYHNCYLVAREAPDEFRQLVNELASLQGVLRTLRDDVNSDKSFLERMGESRKQALERCLSSCFETLHKLQKLVIKYRELGVGDGLQFWKKLKWVTKQGEISELKSKIMVHTCNISLCMSSIGNSSLARIETSMIRALERQQASEDAVQEEEEEDGLSPMQRSKTGPTAPSEVSDPDVFGPGSGISRAFTETTLVDPSTIMSPESTPSLSSEDTSELGPASPVTPKNKKYWAQTPTGKARQGGSFSTERESKPFDPSTATSGDFGNDAFRYPHRSRRLLSSSGESTTTKQEKPQNVGEAVAEAMKTLSLIRQKEQSSRPLRVVRQDPQHVPDEALKKRFQDLVDDELKIRRLNARDWLRAKYNMRLERPEISSTRASFSVSGASKTPANQAYIDLLKAQWILHTIILHEDYRSSLMTDENRKLFHTLSEGIRDEFDEFEPVDEPDKDALLEQNYNIWEFLQPEEESYDDDDLLPGLENGRWITVAKDDAGEEDETVIFRTFVNAAIGGKRSRVRSRGAPYMLLLSTKEGESEPKVTICNQSGTLGLTRDITMDDLQESFMSESPFSDSPQMSSQDSIPLNFGRMNVAVAFTNDVDMSHFMRIPKAYFDAVRRREPRQLTERATETLLFKSSVEIFEQLKASTMKPMSPRQQFRSCDLRVLETTTKEGWRTTRRLVISSSAAEKKPWCTELFLPLSRVQISREGLERQAMIKWSDCTHEKSDRTDGNYNNIYSYIYDDSNPNICLSLLFRNQADATNFESTILTLSISPVFSWRLGPDARCVYNIADTEPDPKSYKALMLTHTRFHWRYSELFYTFRDTDYVFDRSQLRIRFPQASYTDYISTHVDKLWKPEAKNRPHFSHCEKRYGNVSIDFEKEQVAQAFMSSLSSGYNLIFSRRADPIIIKTSRLSKDKCSAEVQLWQRSNSIKLVSRLDDRAEDIWLSMQVQRGSFVHGKDSNRTSVPKVQYSRGRKINMSQLSAVDSREKKDEKKMAQITIAFETVRDREEFAAALEGTTPPPPTSRSPLDELLTMEIPKANPSNSTTSLVTIDVTSSMTESEPSKNIEKTMPEFEDASVIDSSIHSSNVESHFSDNISVSTEQSSMTSVLPEVPLINSYDIGSMPLRDHHRHRFHPPLEVQRYEEQASIEAIERRRQEREKRLRDQEREKRLQEQIEKERRRRIESLQATRERREQEELEREHARLSQEAENRQRLQEKAVRERRLQEQEERELQEREKRRRNHEREKRLQEQKEEERRRRIQLEDQRRIESLQTERKRREQEELEREHARLGQEAEDRQRLQEKAVHERLRRDREERGRLASQSGAGIPHQPRHGAEINYRSNDSFEDRGDHITGDAIRAGNEPRFEGRARAWRPRYKESFMPDRLAILNKAPLSEGQEEPCEEIEAPQGRRLEGTQDKGRLSAPDEASDMVLKEPRLLKPMRSNSPELIAEPPTTYLGESKVSLSEADTSQSSPPTVTAPKAARISESAGSPTTTRGPSRVELHDDERTFDIPRTWKEKGFGAQHPQLPWRLLDAANLTRWIRRRIRPRVADGCRRIEWTCDCGQSMYWDLAKMSAEDAEQLATYLERPNSEAVSGAAGTQIMNDVPMPSTAHLRVQASDNENTDRGQLLGGGSRMLAWDTSSRNTGNEPGRASRFLELCVNTGQYQRSLGEINISRIESDGELFEAIAETYYAERAKRTPINFRVSSSFLALFSIRWTYQWSILKPTAAIFRRFVLDSGTSIALYDPELPPPSEVALQRYHYMPCPLDQNGIPMPDHLFFHFFYQPSGHPRLKWAHRLPKKLSKSIFEDTEDFPTGWGIHILESPNYHVILLLTFIGLVVSGLVSIAWASMTKDIQGAFGIGGYIATVQTVWMGAMYFKWTQS